MGRCFCYLSGDCRYTGARRGLGAQTQAHARYASEESFRRISDMLSIVRFFFLLPHLLSVFYIESKYCRLNIFFVSSNVRDGNKPDNSSERGWIRTVVFELLEIIVVRDLSGGTKFGKIKRYIRFIRISYFFIILKVINFQKI